MKVKGFTRIASDVLQRAMKIAGLFIPTGSGAKPEHQCVRIGAERERVTLTVTDGSSTCTVAFAGKLDGKPFAIMVPSGKLRETAEACPGWLRIGPPYTNGDPSVNICHDETPGIRTKIKLYVEHGPDKIVPADKAKFSPIGRIEVRRLIEAGRFASAALPGKTESKFAVEAIRLTADGKDAVAMDCTDGSCIAHAGKVKVADLKKFPALLIPPFLLDALDQILGVAPAANVDLLWQNEPIQRVMFAGEGWTLCAKTTEGKFPAIEQFTNPKGNTAGALVSLDELGAAVKAIGKAGDHPMTLSINGGLLLERKAESREKGDVDGVAKRKVPAETVGNLTVLLKMAHVQGLLRAIPRDESQLAIGGTGPGRPLCLVPAGRQDFKFVTMTWGQKDAPKPAKRK